VNNTVLFWLFCACSQAGFGKLGQLIFYYGFNALILLGWSVFVNASTTVYVEPALSFTAEEHAWLAEHPVVRARVGNVPPHHFWDHGPRGISVDLLDWIAQQAGFQVQYLHDIPWPEALRNIENYLGPDILLTAKRTREREAFLVFSQDYLTLPWVIFTRIDEQKITTLADLAGKTIAVEQGYVLQNQLATNYPQIHQDVVQDTGEALFMLSIGKVDAYIGNVPVAQYYIAKQGLLNLKVSGSLDFDLHSQAFAVRKDWPQLASILDKGLNALSQTQRNAASAG